MVAVNLNEGQKPCELSDAYPAILHDPSLCGQEGSGGEVDADYCLCPPVPGYGEVPDHATTGLSHRAQAFGWTGMEEGDGLVDNDGKDASEGKDAKDAPSAGGCSDKAIDAAREARDAIAPDSVTVEAHADTSGFGVSVSGTWDTSDKSDSSGSESTAGDK